jgi:hypothetical protein
VSLEPSPARAGKTASASDPSYTVAEFCKLERMSRSALYKAWKQQKGPRYYLNGVSRRISPQARLDYQREREAAAETAALAAAGGRANKSCPRNERGTRR